MAVREATTQDEILPNRQRYVQCPVHKWIVLVDTETSSDVLDRHISRFPTHLSGTHSNSKANYLAYLSMGYLEVNLDQFNHHN